MKNSISRSVFKQISLFFLLYSLCSVPVSAREISIAFIEDGQGEPSPSLSSLIVQELQPLMARGDSIAPVFLGAEDVSPNALDSLAWAEAKPSVNFIVATGVIASQAIYKEATFSKPTYLLRVLDPNLTGAKIRDNVRNLRSYSTVNQIADVFDRLSELFFAKRVGIIVPNNTVNEQGSVGGAVALAAKNAGIDVQFIALDFTQEIDSQLPSLDAVVLPPFSGPKQAQNALLSALQRKKMASYAVGGDSLVLSGALISDTVEESLRLLARRVALDLQSAIAGEARTSGIKYIEAEKRTTINIDTARAIGVDFHLDEIMTARVVQGNSPASTLGFLTAVELATDRNLSLRGQFQQLRIDEETLEQARAARRPKVSAQLQHTRQGEQLPEQSTTAGLGLSLTLYSPSVNASVDAAEVGLGASHLQLEQTQLDTVQQTANAYFLALQSQALFESQLRSLALNRENLTLAENRKRRGSGAGADIYRWQAIIAGSESAVLSAFTDNTDAQAQLAKFLNTRMQLPTQLADVDLDQPPFDLLHEAIVPFLDSTVQAERLSRVSTERALARSPQLQSAAANVEVYDIQIDATRRSFYTPELSLTGQYSRYLDSSENASGIELDDQDDWSLSLKAELALWDGGTRRSLLRQYAAQRDLANTNVESIETALWIDSSNVVNELVANYQAIGVSQRAEEAAFTSQEITQNAYRLGAASITDLLDTQNEYRDAQDNAQIALYQYLRTLVDFQALLGDMPMLKAGEEQQEWLQAFIHSALSEAAQ